jgi:hypothetical protein
MAEMRTILMTGLTEYNSGRWQAMMYLHGFAHAKKISYDCKYIDT